MSAPESLAERRKFTAANGWQAVGTRAGDLFLGMYGLLGYFFLYLPIIILVIFSFNAINSTAEMKGFSLQWYQKLIGNQQMAQSLINSLVLAGISTVISTVFGTMAALAMERYRFLGRMLMDAVLYLPIIIPDIAMAIMLLAFFNLSGLGFAPWRLQFLGVRISLPVSVIAGHVAFNISYVMVIVRARLSQMDRSLEEAAQDLYAGPWMTFWKVTLPMMMPGVIGGALLAFTLSLDDFVITFFTSPAGFTTLPIYVYGMIKRGVSPEINAISTIILLFTLLFVVASLFMQNKTSSEKSSDMDLNV